MAVNQLQKNPEYGFVKSWAITMELLYIYYKLLSNNLTGKYNNLNYTINNC